VTADATQAWHDLLDGDHALALESASQLEALLRRQELIFGDRPLCTVLRPRFFTPASYAELCARCAAIMEAFRAAYDRALADPAARAQFRLTDWEETLVTSDTSGLWPSPTARIDAFMTADGGLSLTEFNGETPAAPAFNDALCDVVWDLPVSRAFAADWWLRPLHARQGVLRVLLRAYERMRGTRALPRIAILDWHDVPTRMEFVLFQRYFESRGIPCVIGDPRDCEYTDGALRLRGEVIDLVYKRVLIHELVEEQGLDSPVIRAARDNAVCFLNGFRSKILHKKASLAVLSDDRNAAWFSDAGRRAIAAHIPWTRVVEERKTIGPDGDTIDLLQWANTRRDRLVLKPNDDYGGAGIVLGWTVNDSEWAAALVRALAQPYIVQERVRIPKEPYPSIESGRLEFIDRQVDTAPFVWDGAYVEGVLTRLSTAELLNVTAGGGSQTPTFLVERRTS